MGYGGENNQNWLFHFCTGKHHHLFLAVCPVSAIGMSHNMGFCSYVHIVLSVSANGTVWLFNIAMEAMAHRNRWFTY